MQPECFQAAELLYLHVTQRKNPYASLCLGYVYSYDRCEGHYFQDLRRAETEEDYRAPYPREERAFECFHTAAVADLPEACYKLGDMYKSGMGCEASASEAFRWYTRASELSSEGAPVHWGSAALRLGSCFEEGFGCEQSFSKALDWYERARVGLQIVVNEGCPWYERPLDRALSGVLRCRQELLGKY